MTDYTNSTMDPFSITAGPDGNLWFTNYAGFFIGSISTSGAITTYTDPNIRTAYSITTGSDGALWLTPRRDAHRDARVDGALTPTFAPPENDPLV